MGVGAGGLQSHPGAGLARIDQRVVPGAARLAALNLIVQRSAAAYGDLYLSLTGRTELELPEPIIVETDDLEKLTA